jgi:hypothetical protein
MSDTVEEAKVDSTPPLQAAPVEAAAPSVTTTAATRPVRDYSNAPGKDIPAADGLIYGACRVCLQSNLQYPVFSF